MTQLTYEKKSVCKPESSLWGSFCNSPFHQSFFSLFCFDFLSFLSFFLSFFLLFLLQNYSKNDISTWNFQLFCQSSLGKSICLGLVAELLISFFWHIYIYITFLRTSKRKYKFLKIIKISVSRFLLSVIEPIRKDENDGKHIAPYWKGK